MPRQRKPLRERKLDVVYFVFFAIHLAAMFLVDLTVFYPVALKPQFLTTIREYYISTYQDQFFINPPSWFVAYTWMELLYHVPLSFWALRALLNDDARVPIQLLIYATQTAVTTLTCIADYMAWPDYANSEKVELSKLYVPYLAVAIFMGVDMVRRLTASMSKLESEPDGRTGNDVKPKNL